MNDDDQPPNRSTRREHRQRSELIALCGTDVTRAVDLACEHLARYPPHRDVVRALCRAANAAAIPPTVRAGLDDLLRRHIPGFGNVAEPCATLIGVAPPDDRIGPHVTRHQSRIQTPAVFDDGAAPSEESPEENDPSIP